jgi:hypothetical protein
MSPASTAFIKSTSDALSVTLTTATPSFRTGMLPWSDNGSADGGKNVFWMLPFDACYPYVIALRMIICCSTFRFLSAL